MAAYEPASEGLARQPDGIVLSLETESTVAWLVGTAHRGRNVDGLLGLLGVLR